VASADFWSIAAAEPERLALVAPDERSYTAGELLAAANRIVHGLRARGLERGDTVAAVLPNGVEMIELYLGIAQAGFYLVPINFHFTGPEIAYLLQDSGARVLVAHERYADACVAAVAEAGRPELVSPASLQEGQSSAQPDARACGAFMGYTGGTTGRPKGVRRALPTVPPEEYGWQAPLLLYGVEPFADNVHLCCTPWYHTAPSIFFSASLHLGHAVVLMERFDAERALELIERYRVTHTLMVPTQFVRLLGLPEEVRSRYDVSSLRFVMHGAAPCSLEVKRAMIDWLGPIVIEYYAATEGAATIAPADEWLRKPGTVGRPAGGADVEIRGDDGRPLPPGEIGDVYILPSTGDFEYFNDPAKTASAWHGDHFTVGDVGYLDEDGYLFLCDRRSETIISGGVNIYPAEIEGVLVAHPKVADVAVFGIPNDEWGEEVKAVVEPVADVEPGDELAAELLAFCGERLARYKLPRSVDFVEQLPRDPNGKLYRRKLREPFWAGRERAI
jgi:long-chain acyl-CoA synthetase